MNLIALLMACRVWTGPARSVFTRIFAAVSLFSVEMQLATIAGVGHLRELRWVNGAAAAVSLGLWVARRNGADRDRVRSPGHVANRSLRAGVLTLCAVVAALNLLRPLEAADPYHLVRMAQIERLGTLQYDVGADAKVNVLGFTYELLLADLHQVPGVGPLLVRLHGLWSIVLLLVALAAIRQWLAPPEGWPALVLLCVPVAFHQFVLVKNDLFGAMPVLVVLAWLATAAGAATPFEIAWAGWLAGLAIGVKLTLFPVVLVLLGVIAGTRRESWRPVAGLALGGLAGVVCGGLAFTLAENLRWYGNASGPLADLGNRNSDVAAVATGVWRFAISLVDFGLVTRRLWPGRGGWGGTFGLPFLWAAGVLCIASRTSWEARRALTIAACSLFAFAAVYPDADIAHRMVLGPGLFAVAAALAVVDEAQLTPRWRGLRLALVPVMALSVAQILRSAALYLLTP